jgi:hypothetical protein
MTVANRHSLYGVQLDDTSPVILGGIEVVNVKTDTQDRVDSTSGSTYPQHTAIVGQKPAADFTSFALQDCLDQIGIAGLDIADIANGLNLYAYKHDDGGGRATGSTHRKYNMVKGLIVPNRITCDHQGDARVMFDVLPTWDGTNDPFTITDSSAVPTAAADDERFTIGGVTIGGVTISQIRSFELDFGMNAKTEGADSDIFDTHASIVDVRPVLTLRGINIEWLKSTAIPLAGKAATHANTTLYLRKRLQTGAGFVADGTAQHVKMTMAGLAWIDEVFSSQGENATECSLKLAAVYDGTNAPVVITTASAIT